ncbi:hypothetical protein ACFW04_006987 [Cataglyphis niger]
MWRNRRRTRGLKRWMEEEGTMKNTLVTALAEVIGTFILVFVGCMGCVSGLDIVPTYLQTTLNFGLAVMVVIQCIGHISQAHINPAITVGAVILGKKTIPEAVVYIVSQSIGGILGFGMIKALTPYNRLTAGTAEESNKLCVTDLHAELTIIQGLILEAIATSLLMLVFCAIMDPRNEKNSDSIPLRFGLTVAVVATVFGPYTGGSMNPARSLGPAVWNNAWSHHWVYWFGPIGGALISSFMYKTIFGVPAKIPEDEEPTAEAVALNSVDAHKSEGQP